jgi:glycosyltransferase involved in cell wall biosynthesis
MKNKILYLHPSIRTYRVGIFEILSKKMDVVFFWSGRSKSGTYVQKEVERILEKTSIEYIQSKELQNFPLNNFSWELFTLPFRRYEVYIFSSITSTPYLLLSPILKILGKKNIIFDELWRYPIEIFKYKWIYPYIKFLSKYCLDSVVASGSKTKSYYINELGVDKNKVFIAYNTTIDLGDHISDNALNKRIESNLNSRTAKKKILYLGRVVKYKGVDLLIRAMQYISNEYDLVIIGDGDFKNECKKITNDLNIENRVSFMGECLSNEVQYYYKNCDIFVLPTRFRLNENVQIESWGFTVNEAISLEIPVVATTAVGSSFDLIIDECTGGVAQAGNVDSLSQKINFIINNNKNNKIGKEAKKNLMKTCNYKDNYKIYQKAVKKALDEK